MVRFTRLLLRPAGAEFECLLKGCRFAEVPYTLETRISGKSKLGLSDMARFFFSVIRIAIS